MPVRHKQAWAELDGPFQLVVLDSGLNLVYTLQPKTKSGLQKNAQKMGGYNGIFQDFYDIKLQDLGILMNAYRNRAIHDASGSALS